MKSSGRREKKGPGFRGRIIHLFSDRGPKLLLDLASLAGGQSFSMVVGFLIFAYMARTMDPTSYGSIEYAIGLAGFFTMIVECGIGPVAASRLARDHSQASQLAVDIPGARLLVAFIAIPAMAVLSYLVAEDHNVRLLVWFFALSLFAVPWKHDWLLQGLDRMTQAAFAQALRMTIFALIVVVVVHTTSDMTRVGLAEVASAAITAVYYLVAQHSAGVAVRLRVHLAGSWHLIREGVSVGLSNMIWAFMLYVPVFLVTYFAGSVETAWYGAAQRIVVSLVTFSFIYFFNFYPVIAGRLKSDPKGWIRLMLASFRLIAWSGLGISLMLTVASPSLLSIAYGSRFDAAAPVFRILIWILPIRLLSGHARWALVAGGRQQYLLIGEFLGAAVLVISGLILVPLAASSGAAIAAVIANLVSWSAAHIFASKHVGRLPTLSQLLMPVASVLICGTVVGLMRQPPLTSLLIAITGYTASAFLLGGTLLSDIRGLAYSKAESNAG